MIYQLGLFVWSFFRRMFSPATVVAGRRHFLGLCLGLFGLLSVGGGARGRVFARVYEPYALRQVGDGVYLHVGKHEEPSAVNGGDIANMGFIIGDNSVAVFDNGYSFGLGNALRAAIRRRTDKPIRYVINSHIHPDHMFGNGAFVDDDCVFIGHEKLPLAFERVGPYYLRGLKDNIGDAAAVGAVLRPPDRVVSMGEPMRLDLGGRVITIEAWKTAHTLTDVTLFDDKSGLLFSGDLVFVGHVPTFDGSTLGWLEVLEQLRSYRCDGLIAGHGFSGRKDWRKDVDAMTEYLQAVVKDVRALIKDNGTIEQAVMQAARTEKDKWQVFDHYHAGNVTFAFAELEWEEE